MQRLTVLGASARALAQSAQRAGFAPYAIDLFADRDLAACCQAVRIERYPADFEQALAAAPRAPWMYTGGLENYPRLLDRLAAMRPLLGNSGEVVRPVRRPEAVQVVAAGAGCRFPRLGNHAGPLLLKPRRGSGGLGIRLASAADLLRVPRGFYLQELVTGTSASAVYLASGGRALLLGATRQLLGRDYGLSVPFAYVGSIGPLSLDESTRSQLQRLGNELSGRFHLSGLFNVDLVLKGGDIWVLEVNPRYSASVEILERAAQQPFVQWHVEACRGGSLPASIPLEEGEFFGKAVVYADAEGTVPSTIDSLQQAWAGASQMADIPRVGERLTAGQPVLTVLAQAESVAGVEAMLAQRMSEIRGVLRTTSVCTPAMH